MPVARAVGMRLPGVLGFSLVAAAVTLGCGGVASTKGGSQMAPDAGATSAQCSNYRNDGGSVLEAGATYDCPGAFPFVGAEAHRVPDVQCVVGQSYCRIQTDNVGGIASAVCVKYAGAPEAPCANDPTCACLCSHGVSCGSAGAFSCMDSDGGATMTCGEF